jgi:hypothetical protein
MYPISCSGATVLGSHRAVLTVENGGRMVEYEPFERCSIGFLAVEKFLEAW